MCSKIVYKGKNEKAGVEKKNGAEEKNSHKVRFVPKSSTLSFQALIFGPMCLFMSGNRLPHCLVNTYV
jgi:hypothetical protein